MLEVKIIVTIGCILCGTCLLYMGITRQKTYGMSDLSLKLNCTVFEQWALTPIVNDQPEYGQIAEAQCHIQAPGTFIPKIRMMPSPKIQLCKDYYVKPGYTCVNEIAMQYEFLYDPCFYYPREHKFLIEETGHEVYCFTKELLRSAVGYAEYGSYMLRKEATIAFILFGVIFMALPILILAVRHSNSDHHFISVPD